MVSLKKQDTWRRAELCGGVLTSGDFSLTANLVSFVIYFIIFVIIISECKR